MYYTVNIYILIIILEVVFNWASDYFSILNLFLDDI